VGGVSGVVMSFVINVDQAGWKLEFPAIALGRDKFFLDLEPDKMPSFESDIGYIYGLPNSTAISFFTTSFKIQSSTGLVS